MNTTSSDVLHVIFSCLDVKEISRKCHINHLFDRICRSEAFWRRKLSKEYNIVEKRDDDTWRNKAKEVYLESILFWNNVDKHIHCYMWNYSSISNPAIKFEKRFIDHALRERKEFFATGLIFREFFKAHYSMSIRNVHFCKTFISLFKKTASLSPQKKISIKWILYLTDGKLCYSLILIRIRILVDIYLKYGDLFIDDVDSINWKTELVKQNNLYATSV